MVTSEPCCAPSLYGTTVETKAKHFEKFAALIGDQFKHGGTKYALVGFSDMEATDLICKLWEEPGVDEVKWILKTMLKYLFRFRNFNREKDLLKIATYCYIIWLKMGWHLGETHDTDTVR